MSSRAPRPRGVDFLINWSMGSWSEERVLDAINSTGKYVAFRYGVSRVGPFTFEEFTKYYERLKRAYLHGKRPDLIVFDVDILRGLTPSETQLLSNLMDVSNGEADPVVKKALFGVEVEVSRWHVGKMIEYQKKHRATSIIGPTFTIKEEDLRPLITWMKDFSKEVLVVQTFYDRVYAIPFSKALVLIRGTDKGIKPQGVRKRKDPKTKKVTYFISCLRYGVLFGEFDPTPSIEGGALIDDMGQVWPMINFINGKLNMTEGARKLIDEIAKKGMSHPDVVKVF